AHAAPAPFASPEQRLSGVWDAQRKGVIKRAFSATTKPYAEHAWQGAEKGVDAYAQNWTAMYGETLRAPNLPGGTAVQIRRMGCLEDRLLEMRSLTELFERGDSDVVRNAVLAAESLTPLSRCADGHVSSSIPPPSDPATLGKVLVVR